MFLRSGWPLAGGQPTFFEANVKDPLDLDSNCRCTEHEKLRLAELRGVYIGMEVASRLHKGESVDVDDESIAAIRNELLEKGVQLRLVRD